MRDTFAPLYPREAQQFRVIERISIPGFPANLIPDVADITNLRQFYGDRLLCECAVSHNNTTDRLAFVNKLNPHGLYDMMILASDDPPKSSIADLTEFTVTVLLDIAHGVLEFIGDADNIRRFELHDGRFHFCYNYDRDTIDRESGMAEKRFHLHLNLRFAHF